MVTTSLQSKASVPEPAVPVAALTCSLSRKEPPKSARSILYVAVLELRQFMSPAWLSVIVGEELSTPVMVVVEPRSS